MPAYHRARFIVACLGVVSVGPHVLAQHGQTAILTGTVKDASGGVLTGVKLSAVSPQMIGGARDTETDAAGRYRLVALLPGIYEITAALQGFRTIWQSGVELAPGLGFTLDLQLDVAPRAETIRVDAAPPMVDVHSSASPTLLDRPFVDNLPLDRPGDGYSGVPFYVNLVPGVIEQTAFGGAPYTNPFSLDGTDGNNPALGYPWANPNKNWIDQVQIIGVGADAEYGEYTGVRVNALTRSGSNRFSGLSEYWTTQPGWTGDNRGSLPADLARQFRPIQVLERWDTSEQLGGPIARDRLWFFSGFTYHKDVERPPSFSDLPQTPDEPHKITQAPQTLVKFTAAPASSVRVEGFIQYGRSKGTNIDLSTFVRPEAAQTAQGHSWMDNVRLTWALDSRTLVEARYGNYRAPLSSGPTPPASRSGPAPHLDISTGVFSGNTPTYIDQDIREHNVGAALTRYADHKLGITHELKAGVDRAWAAYDEVLGRTAGIFYLDSQGAPNYALQGGASSIRPSHRWTSLFAQDRWAVTDHVTITPGIRVGWYDSTAQGPGPFYRNTAVAPRLGIAVDLGSTHQTVLRTHAGRYHEPIVTSFYDFLDTGSQTTTIVDRVLPSGQLQEVSRSMSAGPNDRIDPAVKHPAVDEYLIGLEHEVSPRLSVKAQYIRRNFEDSLGFVNVGPSWTPIVARDPGPDGVAGTSDDGPLLNLYADTRPNDLARVLTNPPGAWRHYDGVQLIGTKRYADRWEIQASYTWSRTRGSFDNSTPATGALGANGNWVNPNVALFSIGRTSFDRPHDVKVLGTYHLRHWGGVRISGVYRYASGAPWARTVDFGTAVNLDGPIRVEPIGTQELPAANTADLRVEKTLPIRGRATAGLYVDVFNISNQGIAEAVNTRSGPNFGVPAIWSQPRLLRLSLRVTF